MPRFFFHLRSANRSLQDCEGTVAADADAAWRLAAATLRDFVQPSTGRIHPEWHGWLMQIADARGRCLFSIPFADVARLGSCEAVAMDDRSNSGVVYLDLERARREFYSVEDEVRQHVRHTTTLVQQARYDAKTLQEVVRAIADGRRYLHNCGRSRPAGERCSADGARTGTAE